VATAGTWNLGKSGIIPEFISLKKLCLLKSALREPERYKKTQKKERAISIFSTQIFSKEIVLCLISQK
jgi:hypothetical protein